MSSNPGTTEFCRNECVDSQCRAQEVCLVAVVPVESCLAHSLHMKVKVAWLGIEDVTARRLRT